MLASVLLGVVSLLAVVAVDITSFTTSPLVFTYPPGREFNAASGAVYPCGGVDPSATRTPYPSNGGRIAITASTLIANGDVLWVNQSDPQLFHDFSTYTDSIIDMSVGEYCFSGPNFPDLGVQVGENVTLAIIYQLGNNASADYNYLCSDIVIVEQTAYTAPDFACSNTSLILDIAPLNESMILHGENFTGDQARAANGQNLSFASIPTTAATSNLPVSTEIVGPQSTTAYAHGGSSGSSTNSSGSGNSTNSASEAAAATSSAAAASTSKSSSATRVLDVAQKGAVATSLGIVAVAALYALI